MVIIGTSHFVSLADAEAYYDEQGFNEADVARKVKDGEIHIGKPALKPGERLVTVDDDHRYAIAFPDVVLDLPRFSDWRRA